MTVRLSRGETEFAKKVWRDVDSAAQQVPDWVKHQVIQAYKEAVRDMERRMASISMKKSR